MFSLSHLMRAHKLSKERRRGRTSHPTPLLARLSPLCRQDVDGAGRAEADRVRQAGLVALDLARACLATELPDDLADIGDARCADRVTLGEQAAAGVDGDITAKRRTAFVDHAAGFALAAQHQ